MSENGQKSFNMNFESILQLNVPKGRDGKHKHIVLQLLSDLENLQDGSALKIPLSELPDTKENMTPPYAARPGRCGFACLT
jgi:hypothetical protein